MRCMVLRFGFSETSIFVALCCVIHALCLIAPGGLGQVTYLSTLRLSTLRLTRHGLLWHVRVISASSTCLPSCVEYVTFWALQTILPLYINFFFISFNHFGWTLICCEKYLFDSLSAVFARVFLASRTLDLRERNKTKAWSTGREGRVKSFPLLHSSPKFSFSIFLYYSPN